MRKLHTDVQMRITIITVKSFLKTRQFKIKIIHVKCKIEFYFNIGLKFPNQYL